MSHKDKINEVLALIEATPGWSVTLTRNGHYKVRNPQNRLHVVGGTPSDRHGVQNTISELRRMGLPVRRKRDLPRRKRRTEDTARPVTP